MQQDLVYSLCVHFWTGVWAMAQDRTTISLVFWPLEWHLNTGTELEQLVTWLVNHLNNRHLKVWLPKVSGIQVSGFQMPTLNKTESLFYQISQEGNVPPIDGHSVTLHRVVDLRHDGLPRGLNAQNGRNFVRVVRRRFTRSNSRCGKNFSEIVAFDKKFIFCRSDVGVVDVNDGAIDCR